jgi:hypothetical protein
MSSIPQRGQVYLIRMGKTNYYKVGVSSSPIEGRLAALQTGNPYELELIAVCDQYDSYGVERSIHQALKLYQVRSEWFNCQREMIRQLFIDHNTMATFDVALTDASLADMTMGNNDFGEIDAPALTAFESMAAHVAELYRTGAATNLSKTICQVFGCSVQSASKPESTYQRALREVNNHLPNGPQFRQPDGTTAPAARPVTR